MRYVLLLLIVYIVVSKLNGLKTLFSTNKEYKAILDDLVLKVESEYDVDNGRDIIVGFFMFLALVVVVVYLLFYVLSMVYVGSFWFGLASVLQMAFSIKDLGRAMVEYSKYRDPEYMSKKQPIRMIINALFEFAYIGYLLYFIVGNWS